MHCTISVCPVGWLMFLTTGSMTIHTIYFLNNDSLLFRSLKGNMKV